MSLHASASILSPLRARAGAGRTDHHRGSWVALAIALASGLFFGLLVYARQRGRLVHTDVRLIARIVPVRYHPHLLELVHPLVHLGDAVFLLPCIALSIAGLWSIGYRRTWVMATGILSWPLELLCKSTLDQPGSLDPSGNGGWVGESVPLTDLVHGAGEQRVLSWLSHAVPGFQSVALHAANVTVGLSSSFPSGTTARAAYALGLLAFLCLRLSVPLLREVLAVLLVAVGVAVGFAVTLFAWHLPSDVLGGYLLGVGLLALACTMLRYPMDA